MKEETSNSWATIFLASSRTVTGEARVVAARPAARRMEVVFIFGVGGGGTSVVMFVAVGVKRVMETDDAELEQWNGRAVVGNLYSATYPEAKRMTMTERAVQPQSTSSENRPGIASFGPTTLPSQSPCHQVSCSARLLTQGLRRPTKCLQSTGCRTWVICRQTSGRSEVVQLATSCVKRDKKVAISQRGPVYEDHRSGLPQTRGSPASDVAVCGNNSRVPSGRTNATQR